MVLSVFQRGLLSAILISGLAMPTCLAKPKATPQVAGPAFEHFAVPRVQNPIAPDPALEAKITRILGKLPLEQKIGQMIQPHIAAVTPEEVKRFNIGSVLNGGGQTPDAKTNPTTADWVNMAEGFYQASMSTENGRTAIPIIWGIDAVHGHGNAIGATLYPHNIALGAARNPELAKALGALTAAEVAATGQDWAFAPTLAVAQDDRWGRTYESFSEDPSVVEMLGGKVIEGLQGAANTPSFLDERHVLATAKHFIGDGGTELGDDQGFTAGNEQQLLYTHLPGYIAALNAGVQTVMASYSWWNGVHSHANKRLMTDLLKNQLGFDGFIISDWMAIGHPQGCSLDNCAEAINAGVDMFMIPNNPDWKTFHANVLAQVKSGVISEARVDDAVRRILRVKLRAGLFTKPGPAARAAKLTGSLGAEANRTLARQAVRESLVLLKNTAGVLPIRPKANVLVAGPGVNDLSMQAGGWSVTWQGTDVPNDKFPGATSIYQGIAQAVKGAGGKVAMDAQGNFTRKPDVAIVILGEKAHAESFGDLQYLSTLELEQKTKAGLAVMQKLKARGVPVVGVLLTSRPLWVNKELNLADAFVVAWQPGTEGAGVADVLIGKPDGTANHDVMGRLSFSWPKTPCQTKVNKGDANYDPLFPFNFGLDYRSPIQPWQKVSEDTSAYTYGCLLGNSIPPAENVQFPAKDGWIWRAEETTNTGKTVQSAVTQGALTAAPTAEGIKATWNGSMSGHLLLRHAQAGYHNYLPLAVNGGALVFDLKLASPPTGKVEVVMTGGRTLSNSVDVSKLLAALPLNTWQTLSVDLNCFYQGRFDYHKVSVPFGLTTPGKLDLEVRNPRYEKSQAKTASLSCQP